MAERASKRSTMACAELRRMIGLLKMRMVTTSPASNTISIFAHAREDMDSATDRISDPSW